MQHTFGGGFGGDPQLLERVTGIELAVRLRSGPVILVKQ